MSFPRVSALKTIEAFRARLDELDLQLPVDEELESGTDSTLGQPIERMQGNIGNRFCILPMEGWDGTADGKPTELTKRRWKNFGLSGAKLIWGGEAVAVRHDGRANPNQLVINDANLSSIESLREILESTHQDHFGQTDDLLVGLQLTHSGRFCRPNVKTRQEARTIYSHPVLDARDNINPETALLTDDDLATLRDDFIRAAKQAARIGFRFFDLKHCHGYLGHELLSARSRPGKYGGSFENRTRFFREIVEGVNAEAPELQIGTRVSIFDYIPFTKDAEGVGTPMATTAAVIPFGGDSSGMSIDFEEPDRFCAFLKELNIDLVCTTAGSPYYNPHIQRPAIFPPSDGYLPPEDPLVGCVRQIQATAELKRRHPELTFVGSAYSYFQEWLPNIGQAVVREGIADSIGLGRMVLSYPDLPADVIAGRTLARKKICRTFSDCTTGPRNGMISGCFPLDPFYKAMPERQQIVELKQEMN